VRARLEGGVGSPVWYGASVRDITYTRGDRKEGGKSERKAKEKPRKVERRHRLEKYYNGNGSVYSNEFVCIYYDTDMMQRKVVERQG
jgi:hypothetical protein